eukprot:scaffold55405_cov68-Phaeocystis_antarctica.AAC.3
MRGVMPCAPAHPSRSIRKLRKALGDREPSFRTGMPCVNSLRMMESDDVLPMSACMALFQRRCESFHTIYYALFCRYTLTPLLAEFGPRDDFSDVGRDADRHLDERRDRWKRRLARLARTHEWTESVRGGRWRRRRARHARDALFLLRPDGVAGVASRNEAIQPRQLGERHHQGGMRGGSGRRRRWRDASASVRVGE